MTLSVGQVAPTITWAAPSAITYGTALSGAQLDATASVPGTFSYSPAAGTIPAAGMDTLNVTFTPTDTTNYSTATKTVSLVVNRATPAITWATPAAITYGVALSATQLDATASVPGTFVYSPVPGATPAAGTDMLSVTFTPTDTTDYTSATKTVSLMVNQTTSAITWATPASIPYGTALSSTQLNATASVPGTFTYSPEAGIVPAQGTDILTVTFTPADKADYTTATKSVSITVTAGTPTITWATPAAITYGMALGSTQLNATSSTLGTFTYSPAAGTVLMAGSYTLIASFTPTDTTDYSGVSKTVSLTVNLAPMTLTANNATRIYGTANPSFTGSIMGAVNSDSLTESFSTMAMTLSNAGSYAIVPSVAGTNLASYSQVVNNGTLTVTQAATTTAFTVSSASIAPGQSVTLTAQVASSTSGMPTGNVQFFDGSTLLGASTLSGGAASYSTAALTPGSAHVLMAVYGGDTNFTGSNGVSSQTVTVSGVLDFSVTPIRASANVVPGNAATYSFQITPVSGVYPSTVNFTATGLPPGAAVAFSPAMIPVSGGAQTVTVSIQTSATTAVALLKSPIRGFAPIALGLLLLPFAGARHLRQSSRRLARLGPFALLLAVGSLTIGVAGCGAGNGFFGQAKKTYTVTITATSGTVQHSTAVTLTVQ